MRIILQLTKVRSLFLVYYISLMLDDIYTELSNYRYILIPGTWLTKGSLFFNVQGQIIQMSAYIAHNIATGK